MNTLKGSALIFSVFKGFPPTIPGYYASVPQQLSSKEFEFDIYINKNPYWRSNYPEEKFSTHKLAEYFLKLLFNRIEKDIS